jgi:hypothetical protein
MRLVSLPFAHSAQASPAEARAAQSSVFDSPASDDAMRAEVRSTLMGAGLLVGMVAGAAVGAALWDFFGVLLGGGLGGFSGAWGGGAAGRMATFPDEGAESSDEGRGTAEF